VSTKISLVPVSISKLAAPRVTSTTDLVVVRVSRPHISLLSRPTGTVRARDDGEIGRPGMKLLELLRQRDLEGLLVVSRIFGGIKLGPGGVGRAFRDAALGALDS